MNARWFLLFIVLVSPALDAEEGRHWAYIAPRRPPVPEAKQADWPRNPIDQFILASMEAAGLQTASRASRARLLRRVYLDLIGLPPDVEEVDAFLTDPHPRAYERVVDRLLASPEYGEHWARGWLDLARHADSNGFQRDGHRDVWAYRDWVIQSINRDQPFDQFTVEQIAGDLLPEPTVEQQIATGFHRSTTVNVEAGVDQEEDRINAVIDRVNTTGTVWLGTTIACMQCHDHKYDPFNQREYYQLFAFFNNTPMETVNPRQARRDFIGPRIPVPEPEARRIKRENRTKVLEKQREALSRLEVNLKSSRHEWEKRQRGDAESLKKIPADKREILLVAPEKRTPAQQKELTDYYLNEQPACREARQNLQQTEREVNALKPPTALVMVEMEKPRATHIFRRGNFLRPGERVDPGVPAALHRFSADAPANRLGLARWLVARENPLVARVTVNRWWAEFFGRGLAPHLEDLGTQSAPPTHPALLDWLAVEFMERGWSMKAIHRLMVTSATYQQSSRLAPELVERDPQGKLYARGPRLRLDAERIRDNALAISGLLAGKMGGPAVRPQQPDGVWTVTGQVDNTYRTSEGEDRYRRSVYTVWRRSSPYPSLVTFDAPDRASACVMRSRTNTPLQALTLMNDPVHIDMAFAFAARIIDDPAASDTRAKLIRAFRRCLARMPNPIELDHLEAVYEGERERFAADPKAARRLVDGRPQTETTDPVELAAWFYVATILLNLDETITKG